MKNEAIFPSATCFGETVQLRHGVLTDEGVICRAGVTINRQRDALFK